MKDMSFNSIKKSIFLSIGTVLFLSGLVFLLIPILPGFLFAFFGLNVLAKNSTKVSSHKLTIKYLQISQKYMNTIKRFIQTKKKSITASIVFATMILSLIVGVKPVEASFGIDSSYTQVKTANSPIVYYLDHKQGKKKAYVSEVSYLTYGNQWSDIKIVHPEALRAWEDITLVKSPERPEVFYIENGTKKWIQTEAEFKENGYNWNDIVTIAQVDLDQYKIVGENPYKNEKPKETPETNNSNYNTSSTNQGVVASNASSNVSVATIENNNSKNVGSTENNQVINKGLTVESISYSNTPQRTLVNTNSNLVAAYKLKASGENVKIEKIILNAEGVFSNDVVRNIYLTIGNNSSTEYEGYFTNGKEVHFDFHHYPINVLSGRDKEIRVYIDLQGDASVNYQTIRFTMKDGDNIKTDSTVYGDFPLKATNFELIYLENILGAVQVEELSLDRSLEMKIGSVDEEIATFKITETTGTENVKLSKLVFENLGSATQEDIVNLKLKNSKGKIISQVSKINGQTIEFKLDNYVIAKDDSYSFSIHADVVKGENRTVNLQLKEAAMIGDVYNYSIVPTYLDINESIKIVREKLTAISKSLSVSKNVFAKESGTLLGVYEIRNNEQEIALQNIKVILSKSETAPALQDAIYLVNYDTGEVYDYAKPVYDDYVVLDMPKVLLDSRKKVNLALITNISEKAQQGDIYKTEISTISYKSINSGIYLEDTVNVSGGTVTVSEANLFIYENNDIDNTEYIKGETGIKIASFYLEASYGDDVLVNGLTLTKGNTAGLVTYENGFSNLRIKIGNKTVGNSIERPFGDVYNFDGFSYILKSGKKVELSVYVDTVGSMRVNSTQLMLSKITSQSNKSGIAATVKGLNAKSYTANFGDVNLEISAGENGVINQGEKDNFAGSFTIKNTGDEIIKLGYVTLLTTGDGFSSSLGYSYLEIRESESSKRLGYVKTPVAGGNRISLGSYKIGVGEEKTFNVYVDGGSYDDNDGFELRFTELTAQGYDSKIAVTASGMPTSPIIIGKGNTVIDDTNDDENNSEDDSDQDTQTLELSWPVIGKITATFHDPNYYYANQVGVHLGLDIKVNQGTPVKAAADGTVYSVIDGGEDHTSYIIIDHGGGYRTLYAHLSRMDKNVGDVVHVGDVIGLSGGKPGAYGSGPYTNGPHLHFEVHKNGIEVDPEDYLK